MSVVAPWVKLSQEGCQDRALALNQPLWLRVALLAYGRVGANGCAPFPHRQELATLVGKYRQDVDRAIRTAVKYGFLDKSSSAECLRPPGDFVQMDFGSRRKACGVHTAVPSTYELPPAQREDRSIEGLIITPVQSEIGKHSVLLDEAVSAANPLRSVLQRELVG